MSKSKELIEEDFEHVHFREQAEIAAEVEALMQEEWWEFCESVKLPAEVLIKIDNSTKLEKKLDEEITN